MAMNSTEVLVVAVDLVVAVVAVDDVLKWSPEAILDGNIPKQFVFVAVVVGQFGEANLAISTANRRHQKCSYSSPDARSDLNPWLILVDTERVIEIEKILRTSRVWSDITREIP